MSMFDFSGLRTVITGDKKFFFYSVDKKEELFKMNFEGLDLFFESLDTLGNKAIGRTMILFDGYNDVATELHEIPQVRKFVKEMFDRYPHVLNYVNFDLEGHHVLLASLLDVKALYKGEKLTFDEHAKKYGHGTPMPRFNMQMNMTNTQLAHLVGSMFHHGNTIGATKKADNQAKRLIKIFKRAI